MKNFEEQLEQLQYETFKNNWNDIWKERYPGQEGLRNRISDLKYDNFHVVNNGFAKLRKALQICDYLEKLSKSKPPQDTEKIRIMTLVSCAEAIYRINNPAQGVCEHLVKGFFKPVRKSIDYKIKGYVGDMPYTKTFDAVEVLYLVRNDYIHNGNFTGSFFRNTEADKLGSFCYSESENKAKLIEATSECRLSYKEFHSIFLEAFIKNIEEYCSRAIRTEK